MGAAAAAAPASDAGGSRGTKRKSSPFRRVKSETIEVKDKFSDNRFDGSFDEWGDKANKDLIVTQGKSFQREKTKKKRGSYRGGPINTGINSIKFDSDYKRYKKRVLKING